MEKEAKRNVFTGSIGFVLAAAGSAVGLGNIWRFPYLAARDGGGMFLVVYIVLALTFGFTLLITEIAIGRKTKQSPLTAYGRINGRWKGLGIIACLVPIIILPYYCAIGGWVVKYLLVYLTGHGAEAAQDGYFTGFISGHVQPIVMLVVFLLATSFIIFRGVNKGIESLSKVLMPALLVLIVIIAVFSLTLSHTDDAGVTRTGLQGLGIYVIPDFKGMTLQKFINVLLDAMGLMFVTLPKVFSEMGMIGNIMGCLFFAMVLFAALTSSVSIMEAVVSSFMDQFHLSRTKAAVIEFVIALAAGLAVCLGYNEWYFELKLPNGAVAQILDLMDYASNNILMPLVAIGTCILIGWVAMPKTIIDEVEKNGEKMGRKRLYVVMVKFVAPVMLAILLLKSLGL